MIELQCKDDEHTSRTLRSDGKKSTTGAEATVDGYVEKILTASNCSAIYTPQPENLQFSISADLILHLELSLRSSICPPTNVTEGSDYLQAETRC